MPWHFPRFPAGMQAKVPAQARQRLLTSSSFLPVRHAGNRPLSILPTVGFPPLADQLHIFPSPEQHPRTGQTPFSKRESSEKGKSFREKPRKKPCPFRISKEFDRHIIPGLLDGKADAQPEFVFVPVLANESAHAQIPGSHIVVHIVFLNVQLARQWGRKIYRVSMPLAIMPQSAALLSPASSTRISSFLPPSTAVHGNGPPRP